MYIYTIYIYNN